MPPFIESPPQEPADLASIEPRLEANINENTQHNISLKLDTLQESQQDLLKKLNAIKSENYIQEIHSFKAEKQLLQPNSGVFTGKEVSDSAPTPSSSTLPLPSSKNKRKAAVHDSASSVTRRIKTKSPHLSPDEDLKANSAIDSHRTTPNISRHRHTGTGSSEELDIIVWIDLEECALDIEYHESDTTWDAWINDGARLREEWKKQLDEFDKEDPEWHIKAQGTDGCVRSILWNQSKCYLTTLAEGRFACKTCWNTNHFCVAWDEEAEGYWLRPLLPAARSKEKSKIGIFDLEMFRSMKPSWSRTDMPAYWNKKPTA